MHKFFIGEDQIEDGRLYIEGQDKKHIVGPLRLDEGSEILVSSAGINYLCQIEKIENDRVYSTILKEEKGSSESDINISLYQGLAKGSKLDLIIQKATEIGVKEFVIVEMDRSISRVKNEKWKKKRLERYNKIAEEAAKQSKRDYIPKLVDIISSEEMVERLKSSGSEILVPYEDEDKMGMKDILAGIEGSDISIVVGPEGGISKREIDLLKEIGARTLSLGPRILRTETAGLVAATIVLYELGDLGVI